MARTLAAAIAEVEGSRLDEIVGFSIEPWPHAGTPEPIRRAFERFDYGQVRRIAGNLARRYRRHPSDAEDATQDTLEELLRKRPQIFGEGPERWLPLVYEYARFRLLRLRESRQEGSLEGLLEAKGDGLYEETSPVAPLPVETDDEARWVPPPRPGESWTRTQSIGAFQRFQEHYGRPPKRSECKAIHQLPSPRTIHRLFDSFGKALLAAGMTPVDLGRRKSRWTAVEAAQACLSFKRRNGRWPDWRDIQDNPGILPSRTVMIRFFGSTRPGEIHEGVKSILGED